MLTTRISRLLCNGNCTFARLNSELFIRPSFIKTFLFYYECILWNWTKIYYRMIHLSDINEVCIILHMRFQIAYILFSRVHSNCEVKAVNKSELRVLQTFFNMPLQAQGRSAFFAIQSTTRKTDFLVVDKSSVILVKRPKIR